MQLHTWLACFPLEPPTTILTWLRCWLSTATAGQGASEPSALNALWNGILTLRGTAPRLYLTGVAKSLNKIISSQLSWVEAHYRSFSAHSSQPISWLVQSNHPAFSTNHLTDNDKTNYNQHRHWADPVPFQSGTMQCAWKLAWQTIWEYSSDYSVDLDIEDVSHSSVYSNSKSSVSAGDPQTMCKEATDNAIDSEWGLRCQSRHLPVKHLTAVLCWGYTKDTRPHSARQSQQLVA